MVLLMRKNPAHGSPETQFGAGRPKSLDSSGTSMWSCVTNLWSNVRWLLHTRMMVHTSAIPLGRAFHQSHVQLSSASAVDGTLGGPPG